MKYVKEGAIIFGITLIGELLNQLLPLPVPSGVYGLFLLLILLCGGIVKLKDVEATGNFLLDIMPILFVPAAAGLVESYDTMREILVPVVVTSMVSTVIVMAVTGLVAEAVLKGGRSGGVSDGKTGGRSVSAAAGKTGGRSGSAAAGKTGGRPGGAADGETGGRQGGDRS